ncbi:unnamed protein product (macronuclear) [Paramecium tetraurelia]|uniref:Uncharacterized protein n=2 Tax=Paramecium TaxID=5884 RepID=A0C2U1_PARTE|nr:uncharacterized protein GSPATT00034586001 [Paramecium tetraurelia]CAD8210579.1 unnamed protein product [Paramecium octaurelia]CAK65108.1 unnamed protein product [Paramecium tetraurelia]|eukprot:XP_001432505.1 hypothetical protein (macronuclear) [Paramecium tetraurelia strain d4-2]
MDYRDLISDKKDEKQLLKKLVLYPLLTGFVYGTGHFLAYLILNQKYFIPLKKAAK